ncbi:MAG: Ig-like domain-containing protein [bacterium]
MKRIVALTALAGMLVFTACLTSDTENPTVTIVFPGNGATVNRGDIVIKAVATDNEDVTKVEFYINGTLTGTDNVGGAGDTFRYTWSDTTAQVAGQNYSLVAKAWDAADNNASSAAVSITIAGGGGGTGPTHHEDDIVGGDSIWYPSGNPHIVKRKIDIRNDGKLIIMPGCVVKFDADAALIVGNQTPGELQAVGKPDPDSGIVFTSNATSPAPGDWLGFDFYGFTRTSTRLSYCDISYAGWENYGAVNLEWDGSIRIDNSTIRSAPKYGIWFSDAGGYIKDFTGNTITACGSYPIYIRPENLSKMSSGNTLTGNAKDAIYVESGSIRETGTWPSHGVPYLLGGSLSVSGDEGIYLTIGRGSTVMLGTDVHVAIGQSTPGGLKADSVTFTSASASPQRGDWEGLWFYERATDAECRLTNCRIQYGGGDGYGLLWIDDAVPTITGCHFAHSASYGIYLSGTEYPDPTSLRANNTFEDNADGDIYEP